MRKLVVAGFFLMTLVAATAQAQHDHFSDPAYPGVPNKAKPAEPVREYSLWLSPSGEEFTYTKRLICTLDGVYESHCFDPHVTVVGELKGTLTEITQVAARLAKETHPLEARFAGVDWTDDYWKSFYLHINDTGIFHKLYDDTCRITGKCHPWPYHMSLMYTDKLSVEQKKDLVGALMKGDFQFRNFIQSASIRLDRLRICTSGDVPEDWVCPVEIQLPD